MSGELSEFVPGLTAWEIEHFEDVADDADRFTELLEERIAEARAAVEPEPEPFTRREYRAMYARAEVGPERVRSQR